MEVPVEQVQETPQEEPKKYPKWLENAEIHQECKAKVVAALGTTGGRPKENRKPDNPTKPNAETWKAIQEEFKVIGTYLPKGATELDNRIAWLSMATDVLQRHGWAYDVKEFAESISSLIGTKAKVDSALRDILTTDLVYVKVKEIVDDCIPESEPQKRIEFMSRVCVWLNTLVVDKLGQIK